MNWIKLFSTDKELQQNLFPFLDEYGTSGLMKALQIYRDMHQCYLCKTRLSIDRLNIYDIYYLEIQKHNITIHTEQGTYSKYGTLTKELALLSPYGFVKCAQNCIVSLNKVSSIHNSSITLVNNAKIHMSRNYTSKVMLAFFQNRKNSVSHLIPPLLP